MNDDADTILAYLHEQGLLERPEGQPTRNRMTEKGATVMAGLMAVRPDIAVQMILKLGSLADS